MDIDLSSYIKILPNRLTSKQIFSLIIYAIKLSIVPFLLSASIFILLKQRADWFRGISAFLLFSSGCLILLGASAFVEIKVKNKKEILNGKCRRCGDYYDYFDTDIERIYYCIKCKVYYSKELTADDNSIITFNDN
jgi:hypothetical protein